MLLKIELNRPRYRHFKNHSNSTIALFEIIILRMNIQPFYEDYRTATFSTLFSL